MRSARQNADQLGGSVKRVGEIAQGIIAAQWFERIAQSAQQFLGNARDAASNLGESVNAVEQVFGSQADAVLDWGRTNATAFGMSERAFNQAVTPMGAMLKNTGLEMGEVTDHTLALTQRASDMASVFNTDVSDALGAINAGLRGEADPLERYGVSLKAATVEARALADTGKAVASELTEQEKAAARVAIVLEQTESVAGDFAATSDGLANSQRIMNAEMEQAQATVGQLFVPALEALNALLVPMVQSFNDANPVVQAVVGGFVLLGAAILTVGSRLAPMVIAMNASGVSMGAMATKARTLALALGPVVAAMAAVTIGASQLESALFDDLDPKVDAAAVGLQRFADTGELSGEALRLFGDQVGGTSRELDRLLSDAWWDKAAVGVQDFIAGIPGFSGTMSRLASDVEAPREQIEAMDQALATLARESPEEAEAAFARLTDGMGLNEEQTEALRAKLGEWAAAAEVGEEATDGLAGAQDGAGDAADGHLDSLEALTDHLKAQADPAFALIKAQQDLADAQAKATEAADEHGKKSPEYQQALRDEAEAALDVLEAAGNLGDEFTGDLSAAQRQMLEDAGISAEAIRQLRDDLRNAKREADRLDGTRARIRINTHYSRTGTPPISSGGQFQPFASGGNVGGPRASAQAGGPRGGADVLVGEQGPEIAQLPFGTRVVPAGQTQAMLGGGGGAAEVRLVIDSAGSQLDDAIVEILRKALRNNPTFRSEVRAA